MKWLKWLVVIGIIGGSVAAYLAYREFNRRPADVETSKPDFTVSSKDLINEFESSDTTADKKYTDKILEMSGSVHSKEVKDTLISLIFDIQQKFIVLAQFNPKYKDATLAIKDGDAVKLKGKYNGFEAGDDVFMLPGTIKLGKCVIVKE